MYVIVSFLSTREGTVFFGTNAKDPFSPPNVGFTTGAFEVVDRCSCLALGFQVSYVLLKAYRT